MIRVKQLVLVDVLYYRPGSQILNEFLWETDDVLPELLRVHKFLNYWRHHIDAVISEVRIATRSGDWKRVDHLLNTH